ncbi:MAG: Uma2 family endonuclease [Cyanobacteria bacterium P01_G01_bin.19]
MQASSKTYYSPQEYLERETKAEFRSEYIDGQIVPMAGDKVNHNKIALNLSSFLNFFLRKQPLEVFMSDLRLWIPDCNLYTYPDVMVAGKPLVFAKEREDTITNAIAIAEILSDSTEKYDRGDKFRRYRTIPSFQEYLLVSQTAMQVEKFTKNDANQWVLSEYSESEDIIAFKSFELEISLEDLYRDIDFAVK